MITELPGQREIAKRELETDIILLRRELAELKQRVLDLESSS